MKVTKKNIGKRVTWEDAKGTPVVGTIMDVERDPYDTVDMYVVKTENARFNLSERLLVKMGVELC